MKWIKSHRKGNNLLCDPVSGTISQLAYIAYSADRALKLLLVWVLPPIKYKINIIRMININNEFIAIHERNLLTHLLSSPVCLSLIRLACLIMFSLKSLLHLVTCWFISSKDIPMFTVKVDSCLIWTIYYRTIILDWFSVSTISSLMPCAEKFCWISPSSSL